MRRPVSRDSIRTDSDLEEGGVTIYQQIRRLLADGEWHNEHELEQLVTFPEVWLEELRHTDDAIVAEVEGERLVRLASMDELEHSG
jgi:hypothetical protein